MRIDPKTLETTNTDAPSGTGYLTTGGGFVWTADETKGEVYKVDASGKVADTYPTGDGARAVSYAEDADELWVGNQDAGTVTAIDALTGQTRDYAFGHPLQSVAAGSGTVPVQLNPGRTYEDRIQALHGDVARLLVEAVPDGKRSGDLVQQPRVRDLVRHLRTVVRLSGRGGARGRDAAARGGEQGRGRREHLPLHHSGRVPLLAALRSAGHRRDVPVLDRTRAVADDGRPGAGAYFVPDIEGEDAFRKGTADHISGTAGFGRTR